MKKHIYVAFFVAALNAAMLALVALSPSTAQVVQSLPVYLDNNGPTFDFGNGPLEVRVMGGAAGIFTAQGSGIGSTSGASTTLTLTATPTTPPCVGCIVNGSGITSGTLVASYNGGLIIGLPTAATVPASSALAWGAACPATGAGQKMMLIQAGQPPSADIPLYTQSRVCGASQYNAGATVIPFALGAH